MELIREMIRKSVRARGRSAPLHQRAQARRTATYLTGWKFLEPYIRWTTEFGVFCGPYAGGKSALRADAGLRLGRTRDG